MTVDPEFANSWISRKSVYGWEFKGVDMWTDVNNIDAANLSSC